jgi:23S rRNA (cytosine1962-C5)-methyltransferase
MSKRPLLTVKPKEGRRARAGAPWLFSNEMVMPAKGLEPGTMVDVQGDDGQAFGSGFFNPKSLIAVRLIGRDLGLSANEAFFTAHLKRALSLRDRI